MAISIGHLPGAPCPAGDDHHPGRLAGECGDAYEAFYREYRPRVAGYVRRHVHDPELIDDIVQETLLRAYRHGLHHETGDDHWRWVSTVARNLCIDQRALHRNWRERSLEGAVEIDLTAADTADPDAADPGAWAVAAECRDLVSRALARLSDRERRLLVQKYVEGRRVREMGEIEGLHVEAIKTALRRARRSFRESYAAITDGGGLASVFGPALAAVGLRVRGWRARLTQTAERVSAVSANIVPTGDALHTAMAGAVVVGLALGPGLGGLAPGSDGSGAGESPPASEVAWGDADEAGAPALAVSSRASTSARGGPAGASGFWSSPDGDAGDRGAPGGGGGDSGGGDDGFTPDSPGGSGVDMPGSSPSPPKAEPVDAGGEDDVEKPEDTWITDIAYAPTGAPWGGSSQGSEDDRATEDEPAGEGDDHETAAGEGTTTEDEAAGSTEDQRGQESSVESDASAGEEPSDDASEDDADADDGPDGSEEDTESADGGEDLELFAVGEPVYDKRRDCRIQCTVLWHSTDGGATWERLRAQGLEADRIVLGAEYPDDPRIYAYGRLGLMVSKDAGDTFWPVSTTDMHTLAFGASARQLILWPAEDGQTRVVVSSAQGGVWAYRPDAGLVVRLPVPTNTYETKGVAALTDTSGEPALLVAVHEVSNRRRGAVYFCTLLACERRAEFRQTDVQVTVTHGSAGPIAWVHTDGSVYRSDDRGRSFTDAQFGSSDESARWIAAVATHGTGLVALAGEIYGRVQAPFGVYAPNGDDTWSRGGMLPLTLWSRYDVGLHATPGGRLLLTSQRAYSGGPDGILCSTDGGRTWAPRCPAGPVGHHAG